MNIDPLLPLLGIIIGWGLKSLADYLVFRHRDSRTYNGAIFFLLRAWKLLKDYDRGTGYFRKARPDVVEFEKWRAVLAKRFTDNYTANSTTFSEAVKLLSQVDPVLAIRLDNTMRNLEFSFRANWSEISESEPARYAQLLYNQDALVDVSLAEMKQVAIKLSKRSSIVQLVRVGRYFKSVQVGISEFNEGMDEQRELLHKAVNPK